MSQDEEIKKLLDLGEELTLEETQKILKTRSILDARKRQLFKVKVKLPKVEGNEQTSDYGYVIFRRWTAGEVIELLSDPIYQKSQKIDLQMGQPHEPLTKEEQQQLFELANRFIAKALDPRMKLTADELNHLGLWAWTKFVYSVIAARSGLDLALVDDIDNYFRDNGGPNLRPDTLLDTG